MYNARSQSAMEYLMTYGWSILVVAVVLGALAYLGVFNPLYFAPKANPGSCQVFRPNGAGTSYDINLLGVCNGEIPQYASYFQQTEGYGTWCAPSCPNLGNYVLIGSQPQYEDIKTNVTAIGWINVKGPSWYDYILSNDRDCCGTYNGFALYVSDLTPRFRIWSTSGSEEMVSFPYSVSTDRWHQIAGTFNGVALTVYLDGIPSTPLEFTGNIATPASFPLAIGALGLSPYSWGMNGSLANVQLYNASLDANSISALYQEGIGGAPIDLQNLVGWWPLNGNANDYSGNGNNGAPTGVIYASSWVNSYNPP